MRLFPFSLVSPFVSLGLVGSGAISTGKRDVGGFRIVGAEV